MRKKIIYSSAILFVTWVISFYISVYWGIALSILLIIGILSMIVLLLANNILKRTCWWRNQYMATEQFVLGEGYRDNIIRNYDIVNLGSTPAHFAFFYENVNGQSWSTGSQGQDMDFEILKYFHSYIKEGGTVLIPIMPFTSLSPYLKEKPEYWGLAYYSKFAKVLDGSQTVNFPVSHRKLMYYLRFPIFFNHRAIIRLIKDCIPDERFLLEEQCMMRMQLIYDSQKWIKSWLKEFDLNSWDNIFDTKWEKYYSQAVELNKGIVDFCLERNLKPVFICVPMTQHLYSLFPEDVRKYLVEDFIKKCNSRGVRYLDYTNDQQFQDDSLYFNSFFLNARGRKLFTNKVLSDLEISI